MASLDSLTDGEIRVKLAELGCPVGPVTATTRKVLIKKLKLLLEQNNALTSDSITYDPRCAITQFSSGEESDDGSTTRNRRKSMPPPKTVKSPRRKSPSRTETIPTPMANSTFVDKSRFLPMVVDGNTSGAVSPPVNIESRRSTRHSAPLSDLLPQRSSLRTNDFGINESSNLNERVSKALHGIGSGDSIVSTGSSTSRFSTNAMGLGLSDSFRSRVGNNFTSTPSPSSFKSSQPYSSDFTRRLSSLSTSRSPGTPAPPPVSHRLMDVKESDDEDNGSVPVYAKFSQSGVKGSLNASARGNGRVFSQDSWFSYDSPVSTVLLLIMLLFFIMIGATYINMHSNDTTIGSTTDIRYPLCNLLRGGQAQPRENCIDEADIQDVTVIFTTVQKEMYDRAVNHACGGSDALLPLSDKDIINLVMDKEKTLSVWNVEKNVNNLKVLIHANPEWKLVTSPHGIMLLDPPTTFWCYLYSRAMLLGKWVLRGSLVVGVLCAVYFATKWWLRRNARYKEQVYKLVSNILDIVSAKAQEQNNFVPISHVRDQLIQPQDRKKLSKLWNDAVALLESDSRLRCEVQHVEGEEFLVWRWLASPLNSNKRKVWQGQAFETVEGSVNSLPDSPTPCLKIRHMFDPALEEGEEWILTVVDAILEKCGEAKILHIVVEKQSREGCVYMKCASQIDAGIAYRALHGSWFDSKLVTVKYIREKRYLERFPDSAKCTVPLYPSDNKKKSLQQ